MVGIIVHKKDAIMFRYREVFANYSNSPVIASKNFYIIKIIGDKVCKVLTTVENRAVIDEHFNDQRKFFTDYRANYES